MPEAAELEMVVGLEVHCQLATASKLFCPCPTDPSGVEANANICPVCTGQPGTLPVLNAKAVELGFKAALALGCRLRDVSVFARKNYFYPDLPKGYQISQYDEPFSSEGRLALPGDASRSIGIHRIHLEEDAGKLLHAVGAKELDHSLVDFNRAGTPLIEIVSEPDMRSAEEAYQYLTALKAILRYLGVSDCDMEKGEMRCDANVSVRPRGAQGFGTKVEVKNLNSFKGVRDALEYEFRRQREVLGEGGRIEQETRLWDGARTATMRSKEEAHDYRYLPDPDLPPLSADPALVERLKAELPELPAARRSRFMGQYQLSDYDAGVLTADRALADYYEACALASGGGASGAKTAANWVATDLLGRLHGAGLPIGRCPIPAERLGGLVALVEKGTLSTKLAREVFSKMWDTGEDPAAIVEVLGICQVSDEGQVAHWVAAAMGENPKAVQDLRAGKERAIGALVGAVMKKSKGKANPDLVNRLIRERLSADEGK